MVGGAINEWYESLRDGFQLMLANGTTPANTPVDQVAALLSWHLLTPFSRCGRTAVPPLVSG
jgi:hypothetical protein